MSFLPSFPGLGGCTLVGDRPRCTNAPRSRRCNSRCARRRFGVSRSRSFLGVTQVGWAASGLRNRAAGLGRPRTSSEAVVSLIYGRTRTADQALSTAKRTALVFVVSPRSLYFHVLNEQPSFLPSFLHCLRFLHCGRILLPAC